MAWTRSGFTFKIQCVEVMSMSFRLGRILFSLLILSASILACTVSGSSTAPDEVAAPAQEITPAETVESEQPPASASGGMVAFADLEACTLVTSQSAEAAFGQPVDGPVRTSDTSVVSCSYFAVPAERFVTVTVYEGEDARNYLLNEITQLQSGCELVLSTGELPTTFPPEVEALRSQSILDLFKQDLSVKSDCWGGQGFKFEQLAELGENVYFYEAFLQGAIIGVATENAFITFLVGDVGAAPEQALEEAKEVVRQAVSP
jgi:hypothetical protein